MIVQKHRLIERYEVSTFTEQEMRNAKENLSRNYQLAPTHEWMDQIGEEVWYFATFERVDRDLLGKRTKQQVLPVSKAYCDLTVLLGLYESAVQSEDELAVAEATNALFKDDSLLKVLTEYMQLETALGTVSNIPNLSNELLDAQQKVMFALCRN